MKTRKARPRALEPKAPTIEALVASPAPLPVVEPAASLLAAPVAAETEPVAAERPVDPVFRLDRRMLLIWLIGAAILVLLHLLDAFYHVLLRL